MSKVKDSDVLKYVRENNRTKLLKLLAPEKGFLSSSGSIRQKNDAIPGGRIRIRLAHVNLNCTESKTGYTPLIIAVINGFKEIMEDLVFHSADVNQRDSKGNTPLHMAVFKGKTDMIDTFLTNDADVKLANSDGNTPLHIACQLDHENRVLIILKLLRANASTSALNKDTKSPLDIAAMFNKTDSVSVLLDHDPAIKGNTKAIVESAIRGNNNVVELLLDFGVNPNGLNAGKEKKNDTHPLTEAVRYVRFEVAETLLKYGANPDLKNAMMESATSVAKLSRPREAREKFASLFTEYQASGPTVSPRFLKVLTRGMSKQDRREYPLLPTDDNWTENSREFCSSCTTNCLNTNLLDGNLSSCWIAGEIHHAWTVLDLKHSHTLTGITIYGWDSPQMAKSIQIQKGNTLEGPWSNISLIVCKREGATKISDPGVPQTFTDFTATSRFWRLEIVENHGGNCICFHGIQLFGADDRIKKMLETLMLEKYIEDMIVKGYNTYRKFLVIQEDKLSKMVSEKDDRTAILTATDRERRKEIRPSKFTWHRVPVTSAKEGEVIPDFSIKSNPGVKTEVQLMFNTDVNISGETKVWLQSNSMEEPSIATFTGLVFNTGGKHKVLVQSLENDNLYLEAPASIEIDSKPGLRGSVAMAFDDMEAMLKDLQASLDPADLD